MTKPSPWSFPVELQPPESEPLPAADSVVQLRAEIPDDAFTAGILGTERIGNGVVLAEENLILTVGYLVTEAETLWITTNDGRVVQGYPLAYDFITGFGLVQALGPLHLPGLARGTAASVTVDSPATVVGHGGRAHTLRAKILAKREFAGYWEYVLDEALFTVPAHPEWGGAALLNAEGQLVGIGSLLVQEMDGDSSVQGNMFVPIDLLEPILQDLRTIGRSSAPARPWLGMYTTEQDGQLVIAGLAPGGPGERGGAHAGDMVLEVAGRRVATLADLFRNVWQLGSAGTEVPLTLAREGSVVRVLLKSADRHDFLRKPRLH